MRINRAALRQAVTDAMTSHRSAHDQAVTDWEAGVARHRADWVARNSDAWAATARTIARKVKKGEPITRDDLPSDSRGFRSSVETYDVPHSLDGIRQPSSPYREPYELAALGKALDIITDDEITHSALRSLGITSATLRDALAQLGRAQ